jgi:hypothetical protein
MFAINPYVNKQLAGAWEAFPADKFTFHPRHGFIFAQNVIGTFLCKSEGLQPEQSRLVVVKYREAPWKITAFVSTTVTVECPFDPVPKAKANLTGIRITKANKTLRSWNGYQMHEYVVVANTPMSIDWKCKNSNGTEIWSRKIQFFGKLYKSGKIR